MTSDLRRDHAYCWHPFTQTDEWLAEDAIVIERGEGVDLIDARGRRYIDGVSSLWCNVHGHRVPEIDRAIRRQLKHIAHSTFLGLTHRPAIDLAQRLIRIAPKGLRRVFFSDSGSEAVEIALKIAFQYWRLRGFKKKKKFIALSEAYHGDTIGSVSVGGIPLFHRLFGPLLFETLRAPTTYAYRCPRADSLRACGEHCREDLEGLLRKHRDEVAGIVIEPKVQGAAGMIVQPAGFVREVRRLADRYGTLLIADEVATGFGRTGKMFACDHDRVSPDLMAVAKGMTGGYLPLAATLVREEIFRAFSGDFERTFFHGHTYTANPLACAAALASLDLFEKNRVLKRLGPTIDLFRNELRRFYDLEHVGDVRSCGLMAGIELVRDRGTREPFEPSKRIGRKVVLEARRHGILIRPLGDVIVLMPPLAIREPDLTRLLRAAYDSIRIVTGRER
jgi:adenosylmethionine-8-amino-7-oxononanoate aminotransferase